MCWTGANPPSEEKKVPAQPDELAQVVPVAGIATGNDQPFSPVKNGVRRILPGVEAEERSGSKGQAWVEVDEREMSQRAGFQDLMKAGTGANDAGKGGRAEPQMLQQFTEKTPGGVLPWKGNSFVSLIAPVPKQEVVVQVKGILKKPKEEDDPVISAPELPKGLKRTMSKIKQIELATEKLQVKKRVRFDITSKRRWSRFQLPKIRSENDSMIQWWNSGFIAVLAYEAWAFAFRLALGNPGLGLWFWLDVLTDCCFLADAMVHSFVQDPEVPKASRSELFLKYVKNNFPTQLVPSIVFLVVSSSDQTPLWLWWCLSIPRLVPRVRRLRAYFKHMEMNLDVDVDKLQIIKFTLVIFLSCHWVGSLYYFIARLLDFRDNTWVGQFESTMPDVFDRHKSQVQEHYLALLYRGWIGLAPNSYRRPPQNWPEQLFSVCVMFMAMYLSAFLIGSVLPYIVKRDPIAEANAKRKADFLKFAGQKQLPQDLIEHVLQYYAYQDTKASNTVPSNLRLTRSLTVKVAKKKFWQYIERNTMKGQALYKSEANFMNSLVTQLKEVYVMPGEEFLRSGDVSPALYFVADGVVQLVEKDGNVAKEVRGDVPDMPCIVAETSFFLGIAQPHAARVRMDGDARLLVLTKDASEKLLNQFPEHQELILRNILSVWNLDVRGKDLVAGTEDKDHDEEMRKEIVSAIERKEREEFAALNFAASMGDIEEVKRLIRRGADINSQDYDGRTILHMACKEGNLRVVELLLEHGAERNTKSRWGTTPLMEAIYAKQNQVIHAMLSARADMLLDDPSGILCDWSSRGEVEDLKLLLSNGVDPNQGDYDSRTALHLASSEGHGKVVELLLQYSADVNIRDRWGGTPLKDAVVAGHVAVASLLRSKGGVLPDGVSTSEFCTSASTGDVARLRMLHACGADPDEGDYDSRAPLHIAASEGKVLAVSFLLGISATVNQRDRWNGTALDDCVRGGTLYHLYCGKMLMGWGGKLAIYDETPEGVEFLKKVQGVNVEDVSNLIKRLIQAGLDGERKNQVSQQERMVAFETGNKLIGLVGQYQDEVRDASTTLSVITTKLDDLSECMSKMLINIATIEDALPPQLAQLIMNEPDQGLKKGRKGMNAMSMRFKQGSRRTNNESRDALSEIRQFLSSLHLDSLEPDTLLEEEVTEETFKLYKELDDLIIKQEREAALAQDGQVSAAKNLNRYLMQLSEVENTLQLLEDVFTAASAHCSNSFFSTPGQAAVTAQGLQLVLQMLGVTHLTEDDMDVIIDEAQDHSSSSGVTVTVQGLVCSSSTFRATLALVDGQDVDGNETKYAYLTKCAALKAMPFCWLREAAEECEVKTFGQGVTLLKQMEPTETMFIIKSGTVNLKKKDMLTGNSSQAEVKEEGAIGYWELFTGENMSYSATAATVTEVFVVHKDRLAKIVQERPSLARRAAQALADDANATLKQQASFRVESFISRWKSQKALEWADEDLNLLATEIRAVCGASHDTKDVVLGNEMSVHVLLQDLQVGLQVVENSWDVFSYGAEEVEAAYFAGVGDHLGEVGNRFIGLIKQIFTSDQERINFGDWWSCWVDYLFYSDQLADADDGKQADGEDNAGDEDIEPTLTQKEMLATFWKRRKFRKDLTSDPEAQLKRSEAAFILTVGNMVDPLPRAKYAAFLKALMQTDAITPWQMNVFLTIYGKDGLATKKINWSRIRKILVELSSATAQVHEKLFMPGTSVFNPKSDSMHQWHQFVRFVATYHFVVVPVRLTYKPFSSISQMGLLCSDLIGDIFLVVHIIVTFNTAYTNKKARWVTDKGRIAKKYLSADFLMDIVSAFPIDWVLVLMGVEFTSAEWTRLIKLLWIRVIWAGIGGRNKLKGLKRLGATALMILHLSACFWSGLGLSPDHPFTLGTSWLVADTSKSFIQGIHGEGRDSLSSWELYCISLNWVATHTVSAVGNTTLYPKNYIEVIFAIFNLTIGMTFYRMVLGQISSYVMKSDEQTIKARAELNSLETFILQNQLTDDQHLTDEIRHHFQTLQSMTAVDMADVFDSVNYSLQFAMAKIICRDALDNADLFKGCSMYLLDRFSVTLREVHFSPEEEMFQTGDVCEEMFLVVSGSVEKYQDNGEGQEVLMGSLKAGSSVGEVSFAFGMKHIFTARAGSSNGAVLFRLGRSSYLQALKMYPEDGDVIAQNSLNVFEKAKSEHGSSKAGSKKGTSAISEDKNKLALETLEEEEQEGTIESGAMSGDSGAESDNLEAVIGTGVSQHIQKLKLRQASNRVLQMLEAAQSDNTTKIKKLLKRGVMVNESDGSQRTALHVSSSNGNMAATRLLLEQMGDVTMKDIHGNTAFNDAVREKHDDIVALIKEFVPNCKVQYDGAMGAVNLCQAAFEGDKAQVDRLLDNGIDVNAQDYDLRSALHLASSEGHSQLVKHLLSRGAYINIRDRFNNTALQDAVRHERHECQKVLREAECQITGLDTAINMCQAAAEGDMHTVRTLVENGVDPLLPDYDNRTALHLACSEGKIEVINYLLARPNLNVNPVDVQGGTPLDDAVRHQNEVAKMMLECAGGTRKGDPKLAALVEAQERSNNNLQKNLRMPQVDRAFSGSAEVNSMPAIRKFLDAVSQSPTPPSDVPNTPSGKRRNSTISAVSDPDEEAMPLLLETVAHLGKALEEAAATLLKASEILESQAAPLRESLTESSNSVSPSTKWRKAIRKVQGVQRMGFLAGSPSSPDPGSPRGHGPAEIARLDQAKHLEDENLDDSERFIIVTEVLNCLSTLSTVLTSAYRGAPKPPESALAHQVVLKRYTRVQDMYCKQILKAIALQQHLRDVLRGLSTGA